jgi:hypothetical protein
MKEILDTLKLLVTEFGLATALLMMISIGEALLLRYVYLEWRKDVAAFTDAAKSMSNASKVIVDSISSLDKSLAEIRGALFVSQGRNGRGGQ